MTRRRKKTSSAVATKAEPVADMAVMELPAQCPRPSCRSTRRTPKGGSTRMKFSGETACGRPYTHIVWSWVECRDCSQKYKIRSLVNEPESSDPEE